MNWTKVQTDKHYEQWQTGYSNIPYRLRFRAHIYKHKGKINNVNLCHGPGGNQIHSSTNLNPHLTIPQILNELNTIIFLHLI